MNEKKTVSVLMSVYANDSPKFLQESFDSIANQTYAPDEIIVVIDGPISDGLSSVIEKNKESLGTSFQVIKNEENMGLGASLNRGVLAAKGDIIVRQDADDISLNKRIELSVNEFWKNEHLAVLGGQVDEFETNPEVITGIRRVPRMNSEIIKFAKLRSPFNHPSVSFNREMILKVGNYAPVRGLEDYDLWLRVLASGLETMNLDKTLVKMRVGNGLYSRRSGKGYLKNYFKIKRDAYTNHFLNVSELMLGDLLMTINVYAPVWLRKFVYNFWLHRK